MRMGLPGLQVDGAVGCVEEPRIVVEVAVVSFAASSFGGLDHSLEPDYGLAGLRPLEHGVPEVLLVFLCKLGDGAGEHPVDDVLGAAHHFDAVLVLLPHLAVPKEPFLGFGHVHNVVVVAEGEPHAIARVGAFALGYFVAAETVTQGDDTDNRVIAFRAYRCLTFALRAAVLAEDWLHLPGVESLRRVALPAQLAGAPIFA